MILIPFLQAFVFLTSNVMVISVHKDSQTKTVMNFGNAQNVLDIGITQTQTTMEDQLARNALITLATAIGVHGTLIGGDTNALNVLMEQSTTQSQETASMNVVD